MIEIILRDGTSLNLKKDWDFEITIEQPMLEDSRIPVPYSTSIALLPTETNRHALGWVDVFMLPPAVRRLSATLFVSGVPIMSGVMEYESTDEGYVSYTFAGKDLEDDFSGYIHELKHLTRETIDFQWLKMITEVRNDPSIHDITASPAYDFAAPPVICAQNIGKVEHPNDIGIETISPHDRYRNWPFSTSTPFCPAVYVHAILSEHFKNIEVSDTILRLYNALAIPGLLIKNDAKSPYYLPVENTVTMLDIASYLPECSVIDLVTGLCKMLCASIYRDGQGFRLLSNKEVLTSRTPVDWSGKVSDAFSATVEAARSYTFGYDNDDDENTFDTTDPAADGSITSSFDTYANLFLSALNAADYIAVRHRTTGDIFSGRRMQITVRIDTGAAADGGNVYHYATVPYLDQLFHGITPKTANSSIEDNFDATCPFKLVRCLPTRIYEPGGDNNLGVYCMAPIMEMPAVDERPTDLYIGCMIGGQLVDHGIAYEPYPVSGGRPSSANLGTEMRPSNPSLDLSPEGLWPLHESFAAWLGRDRQVNTVDLNLSLSEIASFRMFHPVVINHRQFLVKTMRFTFSTSSDVVNSQADIIEM